MSERTDHLIVGRPVFSDGFAVMTDGGIRLIGPNPLPTIRGAEYVLAVIKALDVDCRFPQPPSASMHNSRATGGCPKLQAWLMNRTGESK